MAQETTQLCCTWSSRLPDSVPSFLKEKQGHSKFLRVFAHKVGRSRDVTPPAGRPPALSTSHSGSESDQPGGLTLNCTSTLYLSG